MSNSALTEASRSVVSRFYDRVAAGDFAAVMTCLHPDIEIHEPECLPYGGVYRGLAGLGELSAKTARYLDMRVLDIEAIVADGDRVVCFIRTAIAGTGTPTLIAEESIVRDGKIARMRVFHFDPTLVSAAAGS